MSESKLEKKLKGAIEEMGGEFWKWVSPGRRGVPDRLAFLPSGHMYLIEMKDEGKEPTKQQAKVHRILKGLNQEVHVISNEAEMKDFLVDVQINERRRRSESSV